MIRVLFLLAIGFAAQGTLATASSVGDKACVAAQGETTYKVTGMTCAECEKGISKQFSSQPQVAKVTANHLTGCLNIVWKPGGSLSDAQVAEQLKKVGYDLAHSH